jgi:hypothetical protein
MNRTDQMKILIHGLLFDKANGTTSFRYSLKNLSKDNLSGSFQVVIEALDNPDVSIVNPDGYTPGGKACFIYTGDPLPPGGKTQVHGHGKIGIVSLCHEGPEL